MIQEAYCSFEVAKLLKEKGFDESIRCWYDNFQDFHEEGMRMSNTDCLPPTIMCPTHQMALAWLRSEYNIHIEVHYNRYSETYTYKIIYSPVELEDKSMGCFDTYEEAIENALMQVLTHKYYKDKKCEL